MFFTSVYCTCKRFELTNLNHPQKPITQEVRTMNLLLVGLNPVLAMHCFMTFGVIELIFHLSSFRNSAGSGATKNLNKRNLPYSLAIL